MKIQNKSNYIFLIRALCFIVVCFFSASTFAESVASAISDNEILTEETPVKKLSIEEDLLAIQQAELQDYPDKITKRLDGLNLYGSVRLRYRDTDIGGLWGDGGSRFGLTARKQYQSENWIIARVEAGFNLLDTADLLFNRGDRPAGRKFGDEVFLRLIYAGVETSNYNVTFGKNWSSYYRVTSFTDRFQGTGASASGTFNAGTDGGYSGTGRADRVLQTRMAFDIFDNNTDIKPLSFSLQIQNGEPIPSVDNINYETTVGISLVLETKNGFAAGLAYNHAAIDEADLTVLRTKGIDDDATALALGLRWHGNRWYVGTVISKLENHENTDTGIFFDGMGWEVYGQYNLYKKWWAVAGWNKLNPDSNQAQAGNFKVDYNVVGVRYSFQRFRQMIFGNVKIESSTTTAGQKRGNVYTIGVRWDLP